MAVEFVNTGSQISQGDISEFENKYEVSLPQEYKDFLLQTNGGRPEPDFFPFSDDGFVVTWFYNLKNGKHLLELTLELLWIAEQIVPRTLIPIARDQGGDLVCISLNEEEYGKIYMWFGSTDSDPVFLAESFTEFIDALVEEPD